MYDKMNQKIALYLDTDRDIASYRLVCRGTNDAIDGDFLSFWRKVFRWKYAVMEGSTNEDLKQAYQQRSLYLRLGQCYDFFRGHKSREKNVMQILRDLIVRTSCRQSLPRNHETC